MTKDEILEACTWKPGEEWLGTFPLPVPLFGREVELQLLVEDDRQISDRTAAIVNEIQKLNGADLNAIKDYLWESCQSCCEDISYGVDIREGQSETEANHEAFQVFNREDAYNKSNLLYVMIHEGDQSYPSNYARLHFDNEWEGHMCVMVVKDGKVVGYGEDGLFIGQFETASDEQLN